MREDAHIIQVTGATQSGKSTLTRKLLMQRTRVLRASPFPTSEPGFENYDSVQSALGDLILARHRGVKTFRLHIVTRTASEFDAVCQLAWLMAPCTLALDETTIYLPSAAEAPMSFKLICQAWAHAGDDHGERREVDVIAIGQRPINLPPIFRAEVQVWYVFRLNAERDRALLRDDFGLTRDRADEAGQLPPFHYMRVNRYADITRGQTSV